MIYNYYIGYKDGDLFYPLGPYDNEGNLVPALSISEYKSSDLYDKFNKYILKKEFSSSLEEEIEKHNIAQDIKYIFLEEMPKGSFLKEGYFLIEDVKQYEFLKDSKGDLSTFQGFVERVSPIVYDNMRKNELLFGKVITTEETVEKQDYTASDYMYYIYPDFQSKEYESSIINHFIESLCGYKELDVVIFETEVNN